MGVKRLPHIELKIFFKRGQILNPNRTIFLQFPIRLAVFKVANLSKEVALSTVFLPRFICMYPIRFLERLQSVNGEGVAPKKNAI